MFYGSFTAALPNLEYGAIPEITLEEFDALASEVLPEKKLKALISWDDETQTPQAGVYREMREFDAFLKLRIAEKRQEKLGVSDPLPEAEYDAAIDMTLYDGAATDYITVKPGMFALFFPEDGHAPGITPTGLKKIIIKVKK